MAAVYHQMEPHHPPHHPLPSMPPAHRRGPWSNAEDSQLMVLVDQFGAHNWVRISSLIVTRSPKQCRERYHQNLKPSLNHNPITDEEGALIEQLVGQMGKKWAEIARRLKGRSDNAIKNWWNGGVNRRRRRMSRRDNNAPIPARYPHPALYNHASPRRIQHSGLVDPSLSHMPSQSRSQAVSHPIVLPYPISVNHPSISRTLPSPITSEYPTSPNGAVQPAYSPLQQQPNPHSLPTLEPLRSPFRLPTLQATPRDQPLPSPTTLPSPVRFISPPEGTSSSSMSRRQRPELRLCLPPPATMPGFRMRPRESTGEPITPCTPISAFPSVGTSSSSPQNVDRNLLLPTPVSARPFLTPERTPSAKGKEPAPGEHTLKDFKDEKDARLRLSSILS